MPEFGIVVIVNPRRLFTPMSKHCSHSSHRAPAANTARAAFALRPHRNGCTVKRRRTRGQSIRWIATPIDVRFLFFLLILLPLLLH
ncbi:unnamed protein product [Cylicocyclus nassatus]|uniref:Uncharacterized protein n=1 Tax=Cylicocyclus nassatus TaxID=53992 RepID=A0AA36H0S1_CYLNA|nr:unnamed protein product [Cylicocyclus nassatus]